VCGGGASLLCVHTGHLWVYYTSHFLKCTLWQRPVLFLSLILYGWSKWIRIFRLLKAFDVILAVFTVVSNWIFLKNKVLYVWYREKFLETHIFNLTIYSTYTVNISFSTGHLFLQSYAEYTFLKKNCHLPKEGQSNSWAHSAIVNLQITWYQSAYRKSAIFLWLIYK
jgi:hypothetical protein